MDAIDDQGFPMSSTAAVLVPLADTAELQEGLVPLDELAHQVKKHPSTLKRLLPPDHIVRIGRTPWVHAARSRAFLLAGRKR